MSTKCKYCGSTSYGSCSKSPDKVHEHLEDEKLGCKSEKEAHDVKI